jgi:hypothetical protein
MPEPPALKPGKRDETQLRLLALAHYLVAIVFLAIAGFALKAFVSMYGSTDFAAGLSDESLAENLRGIQEFEDLIILATAGTTAIFGVLHALITAWSGLCIQQRRWRMLSIVIALLNCLAIPVGTILSVFTFVVLRRPSVRAMYGETGR